MHKLAKAIQEWLKIQGQAVLRYVYDFGKWLSLNEISVKQEVTPLGKKYLDLASVSIEQLIITHRRRVQKTSKVLMTPSPGKKRPKPRLNMDLPEYSTPKTARNPHRIERVKIEKVSLGEFLLERTICLLTLGLTIYKEKILMLKERQRIAEMKSDLPKNLYVDHVTQLIRENVVI